MVSTGVKRPTSPLPYHKTLKDVPFDFNLLESKFFDEVHLLYQDAYESGIGYSKQEVEKKFMKNLIDRYFGIQVTDARTGELAATILAQPTSLARSKRPMNLGGMSLVKSKYRGMGLLYELNRLWLLHTMACGYLGGIGRVDLLNPGKMSNLRLGAQYLGVIPNCINLEKHGRCDCLILYFGGNIKGDFPQFYQEIIAQRNAPLAPFQQTESTNQVFYKKDTHIIPQYIAATFGTFSITIAEVSDISDVENMWRHLAENGDGFGIDEFNEQGYFSRKMMYHSRTFTVKSKGYLLGAGVFGPSSLARNKTNVATCYIGVKQGHRNTGIGTHLLRYFVDLAQTEGYFSILLDILDTDGSHIMMKIARDMGFNVCGSLPYSAYVKNKGPAHSLLMTKDLVKTDLKSVL